MDAWGEIKKIDLKLEKRWELHGALEDDGYEYCGDVRSIPVFRKRVFNEDGTHFGKWKAIDDDNNIIDITYEQALGYEAIRNSDKLGMFIGKKLGLRR